MDSVNQMEPLPAAELLARVYAELRKLAAHKMSAELPGQTLQPTALVDEALDKLAARDPLAADLIKLRFFAGLPNVEAARLLGLAERTAKRTWAYARAWLYEELKQTL